ncbi:MAG: hypothetical protein FWF96_01060 [Kiritimatiellaeota bacterium]|nr:hypothetical protein [Kiritimatiellota bacterium]
MKTHAKLLPLLFLMATHCARAEPEMPVGFEASAPGGDPSTWRAFGGFKMSYVMAAAAVKAAMLAQGYEEKHDITPDENARRCVMLWEKGGEKIIIMMWEKEIAETGCAWGVATQQLENENE